MSDEFNMSMRKFLKQVGVTSQQAIEEAVRNAGPSQGTKYRIKAVVTIEEIGLAHEVNGEIEG
ncbi:hypothetical protein IWQ48_006185 [Labrenzia sp. EL_13]|uniref:DUF6494 family protein n=1 Tax=Roseibium album TaxID=311410 RepID=UPI0018C97AA4|nr:hypothetical protein [Labrenzia sp. EL_13]